MRFILSLLFCVCCFKGMSQKLYGTVYTEMGDLLPFSSLTIKGTTMGTSANDKGNFSFALLKGNYTIICQHIGYTSQEKKVTITGDTELTFILKEQELVLSEVVVKTGDEDPAYEIIRQAIKKRDFYHKQVNAFEVNLYAKDLVKLRSLPKKIMGKKIPEEDRKEMGLDSSGKGIVYLSESIAKINIQEPDKFKMEVTSSRVSGSGSFGFTFPAFISLYTNNVKVFTDRINPRGFVSPIADGAIGFYRFKFLGTFWEDGKAINSIRVTPRRNYEPLFSGVINITDDDWRIHSFDLLLTKTAQLEILDSLNITQLHVPVNKEVWRTKNQLIHFNFKFLGIDAIGDFLNVYSEYNVKPAFKKNFFDNIIIKYDTAVNKKSKEYWDNTRPVPLEKEEQLDYKVKDSIYERQRDSGFSKLTIDSLNKRQGKIKPFKLFLAGINRTRYSTKPSINWGIKPLLPNMEYNTAEGIVLNVNGFLHTRINKGKTRFSFEPNVRYGFNNQHLNAWANFNFRRRDDERDEKIKQYSWDFAGGRRVTQFNKDSQQPEWINSINILLYGNNFIKSYENYFGSISFNKRYESGLRFTVNALFEDRIPLNNTTDFTFFKKDSINITPNYPVEKIPAQFTPHQAVVFSASVSFKPGQKFIQLPYRKIAVGSKYPTFTFSYAKGVSGIFGSDVDFDKWKLTVQDDKNLKLAGTFKYHLGTGGFLNSKKVFIQDYMHFNGKRGIGAGPYVNSFQLAYFYQFSNTSPLYGYAHLEHHLNGLLTNKIPLFKRLNWHLVAGANGLLLDRNLNYFELFAGLENVFKIFRVDYVSAFENGKYVNSNFRIGAGGILGGGINVNKRTNTATISL